MCPNRSGALTFIADDADLPPDLDAVFEYQIDQSFACLRIRGGHTTVTAGPNDEPSDVTIRASAATIAAIGGGRLALGDAVAQGRLDASGDQSAIDVLLDVIDRRRR